ncbi:unnamed protein product [Echinostoma caproni]|uniref:PKcGMP_CC domain-containing protein n=1 Tax=Echinostoma caproni TaxID=27848 RepID=A0A183BBV9_9TREM|nr:unnamed protein product [Echinostoma caproni]
MADKTSLGSSYEDTNPMRLDEPVMVMDNILSQAEMLGIIQEQALDLGRLKAEVNALEDQVAKLKTLMLNSPVHLVADQAIKVSELQILDTARMLQADATASKRIIFWEHFLSSLTPQEMNKLILKHLDTKYFKPGICSGLTPKKRKTPQGLVVNMGSPSTARKLITFAPFLKRS